MPKLIAQPTVIDCVGSKPKQIQEFAGRVNSGYPTAGTGAELDAIAAVIIGGASFFGGRGTAGGVFIGAIIMGLLRNGLNLMNVSVFWQQVMLGFIILLAVYLDVLRRRAMRLES